ncbi:hypothetical protein NQ314_011476 [Rhamnusium bicolor]|uniref:Mpv17-like protein 2 n=1 Tax=Rhamnusium bicolor TaxID=1586634 RepID=A0AAV8XHX0_9CUCU|nr:hypothetical protein NQ314_011476 [Rhamnusium bicolor]
MCVGIKIKIVKAIKNTIVPKFCEFVTKAFNEKYLLLTNVVISVSLSGLGDVLEQHYEILTNQVQEWDKIRTRNMSLSGGSVGIVCHYWYQYLDKFLPGYTLRIVLKKIVVDQLMGSPIFISTFFITVAVLNSSTKEKCIQEIKDKAWKLYIAEWAIWPPAQFINFYLLPTKYRVLFDNTVSLGYDVYTSSVVHKNPIKETNEKNT